MHRHLSVMSGFVLGASLCLTPPVWAGTEKVWDNDLKRHLTEDELNHAELFMTEEAAVKIILAKSERVRKDVLQLTQDKKDLVEFLKSLSGEGWQDKKPPAEYPK